MQVDERPVMGHFTTILLAVTVATGCARDRDLRWEQSRLAYCDEVRQLQHRTLGDLGYLAGQADRAMQQTGDDRASACYEVNARVRELGAELRGLDTAMHVVARGRPESQSVEQAGFVLLDQLPLARWDSTTCRDGNVATTANLTAMTAETRSGFERRLERCRSIGWTSPGHLTAHR